MAGSKTRFGFLGNGEEPPDSGKPGAARTVIGHDIHLPKLPSGFAQPGPLVSPTPTPTSSSPSGTGGCTPAPPAQNYKSPRHTSPPHDPPSPAQPTTDPQTSERHPPSHPGDPEPATRNP